MRKQSPFRIAAQNSLLASKRELEVEKATLQVMKGGNNLYKQLTKTIGIKPQDARQNKTMNATKFSRQIKKSELDVLSEQVAALNQFKPPPNSDKTRNLVENIKLRRRDKHIQTYSTFKEDLQEYKENLLQTYKSLTSDLTQTLTIKDHNLKQYLVVFTDPVLLEKKDKVILQDLSNQLKQFKQGVSTKIQVCFNELERIRSDRQGLVQNKCRMLFEQLFEIAFVLQDEAKSISDQEKKDMNQLELRQYQKSRLQLEQTRQNQAQFFTSFDEQVLQIQNKWKQLHEDRQIKQYLEASQTLRWSVVSPANSLSIIELQRQNKDKKWKLITNMIKEHPDTYNKKNIQKLNEQVKVINEIYDNKLDYAFKILMTERQKNENENTKRYQKLKQNLIYVERRTQQQVGQLLKEKCEPVLQKNIEQGKEVLKNVTNYLEQAEQRQNKAIEKLNAFFNQIASRTDDFSKKWTTLSQQYELQKAKILDQDDQVVEKLTSQLKKLEQQLREALHHIKLEEIQKLCFQKVDQIEKAYRNTHQRNKDAAEKRPEAINKFMNQFEGKIAEAFSLYSQTQRNQLIELAKKQCEEKATKKLEQEEKIKQQQQILALQQSKKKGGKPPAAKPKDPKKALAEAEQRKKVLMQQIGLRKIQEVKTQTGTIWLAYKTLVEICLQFYQSGDKLSEQVKNWQGKSLVTKDCFIRADELAKELQYLRNIFFVKLSEKRKRVSQQSDTSNKKFLEDSFAILDTRLRDHYTLKGKLEAETGVLRGGQITNHKKQYEKHIRTVKQKMDLQTEKFNYLLEKSLQLFKNHTTDQKSAKDQLTQGNTLSHYQACHRKAHNNLKSLSRQVSEIEAELNRLSTTQVQLILTSNQEFIKKAKLLKDGGQFSISEVQWYGGMMTQINNQVTQQKDKRAEKAKQVSLQIQKRSKELIEQFDKEYLNCLQELAAKEGTGKKYGKPRRIAQEKVRLQMNKCEQAQLNIDKQIQQLKSICDQETQLPSKPKFQQWREKLMTLNSCIVRYAKHIEAIVPNCKARVMPRVTYLQNSIDANLTQQEDDIDKKRIINQLVLLGSLSEQKDERPFLKYIEDIQKIIGDQARLIYVGDKAKYINPVDKIPQFLRNYIQGMRISANQFKNESIRHLRSSCQKLSEITNFVIDLHFVSIKNYYMSNQKKNFTTSSSKFNDLIKQHDRLKSQNLKSLRPNLSNPQCQKQLKSIDAKQKQRSQQFIQLVKESLKRFEDQHFSNASQFLTTTLNVYEFLILFFDSLYLNEDFVKVSGDQDVAKIHLDAKRLLLMKQKGISIDANSQRNLKKKWSSTLCNIFNFDDKKFVVVSKAPQQPKQKDKKGSKKDSKNKVQEVPVANADESKSIETYKTWRQKYVFTSKQESLAQFLTQYQKELAFIKQQAQRQLKDTESFKLKWESISKTLYIPQ